MDELDQILAAGRAARQRGAACVLATVVRVSGSTYRRPGARMLLTSDGQSVGAISGGCLEREVRRRAFWLTESGAAVLVRYDTTSPDEVVWEFGLGCQGVVEVLLERLSGEHDAPHLAFIESCRSESATAVVGTIFAIDGTQGARVGDRITLVGENFEAADLAGLDPGLVHELYHAAKQVRSVERSEVRRFNFASGNAGVFFELIRPRMPLFVVGTGYDVLPVIALAGSLGWKVLVVDLAGNSGASQRFPGADGVLTGEAALSNAAIPLDGRGAAVIMTHNFAEDLRALRWLLPSPLRYIGQLGPRARTDALLQDLAEAGLRPTPSQLARLHAPVGLDLGAERAEEIALAIVAEIHAVFSGHDAGFLRDSTGPIHQPQRNESDDEVSGGTLGGIVEVRTCPLPSA